MNSVKVQMADACSWTSLLDACFMVAVATLTSQRLIEPDGRTDLLTVVCRYVRYTVQV